MRPLIFLLMFACSSSGKVAIGSDTEGDADSDSDSDTDSYWSGDWSGNSRIDVYWPVWNFPDACRGDATLAVDESGDVSGSMGCDLDERSTQILIDLSGDIDGGEAHVEINGGENEDMAWSVTFEDPTTIGEIEGTMTAYGEHIDLTVSFEVER